MSKTRAFDLIINLGVHAHLLEPPALDGSTLIEEQYSQESYFDNGTQDSTNGIKPDFFKKTGNSSAIEKFECWILGILFEVLLHLVQVYICVWKSQPMEFSFGVKKYCFLN